MKKILTAIFVTLGVIFFIIILTGTYFVIADPFELRPLIFGGSTNADTQANSEQTTDAHPLLSPAQEKALNRFGIDPAALPTEITPEQESCFEAKLGAERVTEIKNGASPTASEFFTARECV